MALSPFDLAVFAAYAVALVAIAWLVSRREKDSAEYFLAGRNLGGWVIGASLIASNISAEHFVGMAGSGFHVGLAVAAYEWMAAVTLVVVGKWFLPVFLRHGIYTMPEYLEVRFSWLARTLFAVLMLLAHVFVTLPVVLSAGAKALHVIFDMDITAGIVALAAFGGAYTIYGGLRAVVFTDVLQVTVLLVGGAVALWLSLAEVGGFGRLLELEPERFHTVLPADHPELPWVGVFLGGMWVANFFYWGCNQFIVQRTLAARSLAAGQRGILLAAGVKLVIPFLIVVPGIAAHHLYGDALADKDFAYPRLVKELLPAGLSGLMLAALLGAVLSSVDSMLNSASTIFTMDLYRKLRPQATPRRLIVIGRWSTAAIMLAGAAWAPVVAGMEEGVFHYIQEAWGFLTPGVLAVFALGLATRSASSAGAVTGLILAIPTSVGLRSLLPDTPFLTRMGVVFAVLVLLIAAVSGTVPDQERERKIPIPSVDQTPARGYAFGSAWIIAATVGLYVLFF